MLTIRQLVELIQPGDGYSGEAHVTTGDDVVAHLVVRLGSLHMKNLQLWFVRLKLHPRCDMLHRLCGPAQAWSDLAFWNSLSCFCEGVVLVLPEGGCHLLSVDAFAHPVWHSGRLYAFLPLELMVPLIHRVKV